MNQEATGKRFAWIVAAICLSPCAALAADWQTDDITTAVTSGHSIPAGADLDARPALGQPGQMMAAWTYLQDPSSQRAIWYSRSADAGITWDSAPVRSVPLPAGAEDANAAIATDEQGTWVAVWQSTDDLGETTASDWDVLVARSTDFGETWSQPQLLNSHGTLDAGDDTRPAIAMDGQGNAVVLWVSENALSGSSLVLSDQTCLWISRSTDNGSTWSAGEIFREAALTDLSQPKIEASADSSFGATWLARQSGETAHTVQFSYTADHGSVWTAPTIVNPVESPIVSVINEEPTVSLAGHDNGQWMILWDSLLTGSRSTLMARTPDSGATWLEPQRLFQNQYFGERMYQHISRPTIMVTHDGKWLAGTKLTLIPQSQPGVAMSEDFGDNWLTAPAMPAVPPYPGGYQTVLDRKAPYVWITPSDHLASLYAQTSNGVMGMATGYWYLRRNLSILPIEPDTGNLPPLDPQWSTVQSFTGTALHGTDPSVATNGEQYITVYSGPTTGKADTDIQIARSGDGIVWVAPEPLNRDTISETQNDSYPALANDGDATWIAVWNRGGTCMVARSDNNGQNWSIPEEAIAIPMNSAQLQQSKPSIAYLGGQEWVVLWHFSLFRSTDNGATWSHSRNILSGYSIGTCGNTTPCTAYSHSAPQLYASPDSPLLVAQFTVTETHRPQGFSGPAVTSHFPGGFVSMNKGHDFPETHTPPYTQAPYLRREGEFLYAGKDTWLVADVPDNQMNLETATVSGAGGPITFAPAFQAPDAQRRDLWISPAVAAGGQIAAIWSADYSTSILHNASELVWTSSADYGATWNSISRIDRSHVQAYGKAMAGDSAGNPGGNGYLAVVQLQDAAGENTIWFAQRDLTRRTCAADWQLFK